jgi:hypothetical protein
MSEQTRQGDLLNALEAALSEQAGAEAQLRCTGSPATEPIDASGPPERRSTDLQLALQVRRAVA